MAGPKNEKSKDEKTVDPAKLRGSALSEYLYLNHYDFVVYPNAPSPLAAEVVRYMKKEAKTPLSGKEDQLSVPEIKAFMSHISKLAIKDGVLKQNAPLFLEREGALFLNSTAIWLLFDIKEKDAKTKFSIAGSGEVPVPVPGPVASSVAASPAVAASGSALPPPAQSALDGIKKFWENVTKCDTPSHPDFSKPTCVQSRDTRKAREEGRQ